MDVILTAFEEVLKRCREEFPGVTWKVTSDATKWWCAPSSPLRVVREHPGDIPITIEIEVGHTIKIVELVAATCGSTTTIPLDDPDAFTKFSDALYQYHRILGLRGDCTPD